ncbi:phosphoglycerate mutase-like protein [Meredithblackwellia eburnea MCA 4105]
MASNNTNPVIGVVMMMRHGDRQGFYQSPTTYTATATAITPVGEFQEYQLGDLMRRTYAVEDSPSYITGLNPTELIATQINSTADGGGEGGVIFDSAMAMWQGFYPPRVNVSQTTLANGSVITSPLGGYQYLQVQAVLPTDDVDFEGWTNCNAWTNRTNNFYVSAPFLAKQTEYQSFLTGLQTSGLVGGRNVTLSNMWNIFDFMNVQNIHNATYAAMLNATGPSTLPIVRYLANYHEYGAFTDTSPSGIGNVAGRTIFSRIIPSLQAFANGTDIKIAHYQTAYKPFLSVFNMTNVAGSGVFPEPQGIVDYASVMTLEVRKNMAGTGHDVRFGFKNGTADGEANGLTYYPLFGSSSIDFDLNTFINNIQPSVIPDNKAWCVACASTTGICPLYLGLTSSSNSSSNATITASHSSLSNAAAGAIGFAVTTAAFIALLAVLAALGMVTFGAATHNRRRRQESVPLKAGSFSSQQDVNKK